MLLLPFENFYRQNMQEQQKRVQATTRLGAPPGPLHPPSHPSQNRPTQTMSIASQSGQLPRGIAGGSMNQISGPHTPLTTMNGTSQTPSQTPQRPGSTALNQPTHGTPHSMPGGSLLDSMANGHMIEGNVLEQETQGIKRKMDFDQGDKRARQKTGKFLTYPYIIAALNPFFLRVRTA